MFRRFLTFCLVCLVLSAAPVEAQPGGSLSSFSFLRLEPSARTSALGGAFVAMADGDVNALFYNPSIPGSVTRRSASVSYLNHLSDLNAGSVGYSHSVPELGTTLTGGVRFAHWGTLEGRDQYGEPTGDFSAGDVALTLGAARPYGRRARYGMNVHILHASIDQARAAAVAMDLGAVYRLLEYNLVLGASLRNLGVPLESFGRERATLPLDLQLGLSKGLAHLPLVISVAAYDLTNLDEGIVGGTTVDHVLAHLVLGTELHLGETLRFRLGYNHRRSQELVLTDRFDLAGFGAGFGINVDRLSIDYSYSSWSTLGGLHQFTVRADLSDL